MPASRHPYDPFLCRETTFPLRPLPPGYLRNYKSVISLLYERTTELGCLCNYKSVISLLYERTTDKGRGLAPLAQLNAQRSSRGAGLPASAPSALTVGSLLTYFPTKIEHIVVYLYNSTPQWIT